MPADGAANHLVAQGLRAVVLEDADQVRALDGPWRELHQRSGVGAAQSAAFVTAAWSEERRDGAKLAVITILNGGELVGVWPLLTHRDGGVIVAEHVGCGAGEEYADPMIDPSSDGDAIAELMLQAARRVCDVLRASALAKSSTVAKALRAAPGFRYRNEIRSPIASLSRVGDLDDWCAGKSRSFRQGLRQDRRRLGDLGKVTFREAITADDGRRLADWVFETKRDWLARQGISRSWLLDPGGQRILAKIVGTDCGRRDGVLGFALMLDDHIVAAGIGFRSPKVLEYYVAGFDPAYEKVSPGNLLIEDCARWCVARGLDFDFRVTHETYKFRWADGFDHRETFLIAGSLRGAPHVLRAYLRRARFRLGTEVGARLRRLRKAA